MENTKAPAPKVFYFGTMGKGHRLYDADGEDMHRIVVTPWGNHIDGMLAPDGLVYETCGWFREKLLVAMLQATSRL